MQHKQAGFTLVEIAIVLVIVGLLLGGVLKGQELINGAKVKALANDLRAVSTAYYAYQDRFRAVPGDDPQANVHLTDVTGSPNGNGNGMIDDTGNVFGTQSMTVNAAAARESQLFWVHVRLANLMTGPAYVGAAQNSLGGFIGITSNKISNQTGVGLWNAQYYICLSGVPQRLAVQLDTQIDDGVPNTGALRAFTETGGAPAALNPGTGGVAPAATWPTAETSFTVCQAN